MQTFDFILYIISGLGALTVLFILAQILHNYLAYAPNWQDLITGSFLGCASFLFNYFYFSVQDIPILNLKFLLLIFLVIGFNVKVLLAFTPFYLLSVYFSSFSPLFALSMLAIAFLLQYSKLKKEYRAGLLFFTITPVNFSEIYIYSYLDQYNAEVLLTLAVAGGVFLLTLLLVTAAFYQRNFLKSVFLTRYLEEFFSKFNHVFVFRINQQEKTITFSRKCCEDLELKYEVMPLEEFQQIMSASADRKIQVINQKVERTLFVTPLTGKEIYLEYFCYPHFWGGYSGMIRDITVETTRSEVLFRAKTKDSITGLPTFSVMKESVLELCLNSFDLILFATIKVDLDIQKNTVYEIEYELACYKFIANLLKSEFPSAAIFSIKSGEFMLALAEYPQMMRDQNPITKLESLFSSGYDIDGKQVMLKAKIGLLYTESRRVQTLSEVEDVLRKLRFCTYMLEDKETNNLYLFVQSQYDRYNEKMIRIRYLPNILLKGDFNLVFQPVMDIRSGQSVFMEVLLRINNEIYSNTGQFISDCISAGLDVNLDQMILKKILVDVKSGLIDFDLSVNLLANTPISDEIQQIAALLRSKGKTLYLEFTEYIFKNPSETLLKAEQLRNYGVKILADNYGSGFSNSVMLSSINFDGLKIPITLIDKIQTDRKALCMIKSIVDYCASLAILCIADGIEVKEQVDILKDLGVFYGQGYYLSPPQKIEAKQADPAAGDSQ